MDGEGGGDEGRRRRRGDGGEVRRDDGGRRKLERADAGARVGGGVVVSYGIVRVRRFRGRVHGGVQRVVQDGSADDTRTGGVRSEDTSDVLHVRNGGNGAGIVAWISKHH